LAAAPSLRDRLTKVVHVFVPTDLRNKAIAVQSGLFSVALGRLQRPPSPQNAPAAPHGRGFHFDIAAPALSPWRKGFLALLPSGRGPLKLAKWSRFRGRRLSQNIEAERRLAAILAADVAGFGRLTEADEVGTMRKLAAQRTILDAAIARHRGRIANTAGDSVLAEFPSAVNAVQCAVEAQQALRDAAEGTDEDRRVLFRIGIHVGDVMVRNGDLLGGGVNVAARLEALADAGGILISAAAHEQVKKILPLAYSDLGPQQVKNIDEPIRAFAIGLAPAATAAIIEPGKLLPLPDKPSIAVLPFQNMSGDPDQEHFADGMVEDIITALSRFKSLFVIARNSSFTYKGKLVDIKRVGRELGVRYVLEGSVRKAGTRVRITGQLIEAETGTHIWADRFEGALESIFDLQDDVTAQVVGAIAPAVEKEEIDRARRKPTDSIDAVTEYYRGLALSYSPNPDNIARALDHLRRAMEIDPSFVAPRGRACICLFFRHVSGWPANREADNSELQRLAQQVREAADDASALSSAAFAVSSVFGDLDAAGEMAGLALRANPNLASAHYAVGHVKALRGESDSAIADLEHGMRLSPHDHRIGMGGIALAHYNAGRYEQAVSWCERLLRRFPHAPQAASLLIASYSKLGRTGDVRRAVVDLLDRVPGFRVANMLVPGGPKHLKHLRDDYRRTLKEAGLPE
jgi:adenylate cyclase